MVTDHVVGGALGDTETKQATARATRYERLVENDIELSRFEPPLTTLVATDSDSDGDGLAENASAESTVGIDVRPGDPAVGKSPLTYSVDDSRFTVDATGTVRVAHSARFDFEAETAIVLRVTATAADGTHAPRTLVDALARAQGIPAIEYTYDFLLEAAGTALLYCPLQNFAGGDLTVVREMMSFPHVTQRPAGRLAQSRHIVRDLPVGGCRLMQETRGYRHTGKRGVVTLNDGQSTCALLGTLVRGATSVPAAPR